LENWKAVVATHNMGNWLNLEDVKRNANLSTTYDIYSTPIIYLLDKNKEIVLKRVDAKQLVDYINSQSK
jgi:hypothetical protein